MSKHREDFSSRLKLCIRCKSEDFQFIVWGVGKSCITNSESFEINQKHAFFLSGNEAPCFTFEVHLGYIDGHLLYCFKSWVSQGRLLFWAYKQLRSHHSPGSDVSLSHSYSFTAGWTGVTGKEVFYLRTYTPSESGNRNHDLALMSATLQQLRHSSSFI